LDPEGEKKKGRRKGERPLSILNHYITKPSLGASPGARVNWEEKKGKGGGERGNPPFIPNPQEDFEEIIKGKKIGGREERATILFFSPITSTRRQKYRAPREK